MGFRKWAILRVASLWPSGESMKSSLTSIMVSSNGCSFIMAMTLFCKKLESLLRNCDGVWRYFVRKMVALWNGTENVVQHQQSILAYEGRMVSQTPKLPFSGCCNAKIPNQISVVILNYVEGHCCILQLGISVLYFSFLCDGIPFFGYRWLVWWHIILFFL